MVSFMLRPLYHRGGASILIDLEAVWAPELVSTFGGKKNVLPLPVA